MNWLAGHTTKQACIAGFVFGLCSAFAFVVGGQAYRTNSLFAGIDAGGFLCGLGAFIAITLIVGVLAALFFAAIPRIERKGSAVSISPRLTFFVIWVALFLAWLICLHAYWPGLLTYDIPTQTDFVYSGNWTTQQPPIHTLIWAFFLQLEGMAGLHAITWYSLFQMLCLSAALAAVVKFMVQQGIKRWVLVLALIFLFANPVLAIFSISPTKDVLLAACFVMFSLELVRFSANTQRFSASKVHCAAFAVWLVLCCLLRSNTVVVVVLFAFIAFFVLRPYWKNCVALCAIALACTLVISGVGNSLLGVKAGSGAFVSVPVQQVAHVLVNHKDSLPESELATVETVLPIDQVLEDYNPRFADKTVRLFKGKSTGAVSMLSQLGAVAKLWFVWGLRYPADYVDAFISLNIPYWYPFAEVPDTYSQRAYIETQRWKESSNYTVDLPDPTSLFYTQYEQAADYGAFANNPLLSLIFSPARPILFVLLALCALLGQSEQERKRWVLVVVFMLLFWVSFMFGPVSNMRYMFPLFCSYPLLWMATLQPSALFGEAGRMVALQPSVSLGGEDNGGKL